MGRSRKNRRYQERQPIDRRDTYEIIQERFDPIGIFVGIPVYDINHTLERFEQRFTGLTKEDWIRTLKKGLFEIKKLTGFKEAENYVIISRSLGLRILVEIREDKFIAGRMIAVSPSTLEPHHIRKLRNDIEIIVESEIQNYGNCDIFYSEHLNNESFFAMFIEGSEIYQSWIDIEIDE